MANKQEIVFMEKLTFILERVVMFALLVALVFPGFINNIFLGLLIYTLLNSSNIMILVYQDGYKELGINPPERDFIFWMERVSMVLLMFGFNISWAMIASTCLFVLSNVLYLVQKLFGLKLETKWVKVNEKDKAVISTLQGEGQKQPEERLLNEANSDNRGNHEELQEEKKLLMSKLEAACSMNEYYEQVVKDLVEDERLNELLRQKEAEADEFKKEKDLLAQQIQAAAVILDSYLEQVTKIEEENKKLAAKVRAYKKVINSRLRKHGKRQQKWEEGRKFLMSKLEAAYSMVEYYEKVVKNCADHQDETRNELLRMKAAAIEIEEEPQVFEDCIECTNKLEEKNKALAAMLSTATEYAEDYRASLRECEEKNKILTQKNNQIASELSAMISSATGYQRRGRMLEILTDDLNNKLCAANMRSEMYKSLLHNFDR